jgi:hypothetical protein
MAQSVPTAEFVPCIVALPSGWTMTDAHSATGYSSLRFKGGTENVALIIRLDAECDLTGMFEVSDDRPGVRRYEAGSAARFDLAYRLQGACLTFRSETPSFAESNDFRVITESIGFIARDELRVLTDRVL